MLLAAQSQAICAYIAYQDLRKNISEHAIR